MTQFRPFRGLFYNDPGSSPDDGVLDVSLVLDHESTSEFAVKKLDENPGLIEVWLDSQNLYEDAEPGFYMFRAGWRDDHDIPHQVSGVFGSVDPISGPAVQISQVQIPDPEFDLLLMPTTMPIVTASLEKTHWRIWPLRQRGVIELIASAVEPRLSSGQNGLVVASTQKINPPIGLVLLKEFASKS